MEGCIKGSVHSGIWGIDVGTKLDVRKCSMGNW